MIDPILIDLYPGDLHGMPDISKLAAAGYPWCGVWIKSNQGVKFYDSEWFNRLWLLARDCVGDDRRGINWFRGTYDYADLTCDPATECEFALKQIENAGGFGCGDMNPCIDMEETRNPDKPGRARIEDWLNKYAERMLALHGRRPTLYGNVYLRENGVQGLCGCEDLIIARYTLTLPRTIYEDDLKIPLAKLRGWQYAGTGDRTPIQAGYPEHSPLAPSVKVDLTEIVQGLSYLVTHGYTTQCEAI